MNLEPHWQFAITAAKRHLYQLVWSIDAVAEADSQAVAGVSTPHELIHIVEGFLNEGILLQRDTQEFLDMKSYLQSKLTPAYEGGSNKAHELWTMSSPDERTQFDAMDLGDFRKIGQNLSPAEMNFSERYWFIEGFCTTLREEWMNHLMNRSSDNGKK